MASITSRNLDDDVKTRLRVRAADNGRSMEEDHAQLVRMIGVRQQVGRLGLELAPAARQFSSGTIAAASRF